MGNLSVQKDGVVFTIKYAGDADIGFVNEFSRLTAEIQRDHPQFFIILDLKEVGFIDSMALSVLINLIKILKKKRQRLYIYKPSEVARDVLVTTNIDKLAEIRDDMAQIRQSIERAMKRRKPAGG